MVSSYHSKIRSTQNKGVTFLFCFGHGLLGGAHGGAQQEISQCRGDFVELGHFDKHFVKNTRKKRPFGNNSGVFSPRFC